MARPRAESPRDNFANVRLTSGERVEIESTARSMGLKSISEYVRHLHQLNSSSAQQNRSLYEVSPQAMYDGNRLDGFFETRRGKIYHGDGLDYLFGKAKQESVDLIVTSPPFGLVRKKS